ncbi:MAG: hypothetical protein IT460_04130 [Planctomycetes bacterium]|nr:hypothetical protein [Planctomycetota bacterium]
MIRSLVFATTLTCLAVLGSTASAGDPVLHLHDAVAQGKVSVEVTAIGGSTGDTVQISVKRLGKDPIHLDLAPGTVFRNVAGTVQDMAGSRIKGERVGASAYTPAVQISLVDDQPHVYVVEAYCMDFHKANPGAGDKFRMEAPTAETTGFMTAAVASGRSIQQVQAALWIKRDGVGDTELMARFPVSAADLKATRQWLANPNAGTALPSQFVEAARARGANQVSKRLLFRPPSELGLTVEQIGLAAIMTLLRAFPDVPPDKQPAQYVPRTRKDEPDLLANAYVTEQSDVASVLKVLSELPMPWTFTKVHGWCRESRDAPTRMCLLRALTFGGDPRAALVLGDAMRFDESITVRVSSAWLITSAFLPEKGELPNADSVRAAIDWWQTNGARIQAEEAAKDKAVQDATRVDHGPAVAAHLKELGGVGATLELTRSTEPDAPKLVTALSKPVDESALRSQFGEPQKIEHDAVTFFPSFPADTKTGEIWSYDSVRLFLRAGKVLHVAEGVPLVNSSPSRPSVSAPAKPATPKATLPYVVDTSGKIHHLSGVSISTVHSPREINGPCLPYLPMSPAAFKKLAEVARTRGIEKDLSAYRIESYLPITEVSHMTLGDKIMDGGLARCTKATVVMVGGTTEEVFLSNGYPLVVSGTEALGELGSGEFEMPIGLIKEMWFNDVKSGSDARQSPEATWTLRDIAGNEFELANFGGRQDEYNDNWIPPKYTGYRSKSTLRFERGATSVQVPMDRIQRLVLQGKNMFTPRAVTATITLGSGSTEEAVLTEEDFLGLLGNRWFRISTPLVDSVQVRRSSGR